MSCFSTQTCDPVMRNTSGSLTIVLSIMLLANLSTVSALTTSVFTEGYVLLTRLTLKNQDILSLQTPSSSSNHGLPPVSTFYRSETMTGGSLQHTHVAEAGNLMKDAVSQTQDFFVTFQNAGKTLSFATSSPRNSGTSVSDTGQGVVGAAEYLQTLAITSTLRLIMHLTAIPLNSMNIVVYSKKTMRSPTATYQVAMSTSQVMYLLAVLVIPIARLLYTGVDSSYFGLVYSMGFGHYFMLSVNRIMNGLICLVSVERFLAIAFPLKSKLFSVSKTPLVPIVLLCLASFVSHIYQAIKYDFYEVSGTISHSSSASSCSGTVYVSKLSLAPDIVSTYTRQKEVTSPRPETFTMNLSETNNNITFLYSMASQAAHSSGNMLFSQTSTEAINSLCTASKNQSVLSTVVSSSWSMRYSDIYLWSPGLMDTWATVASGVWMYGALLFGLLANALLAASLWSHTRLRSNITTSDSTGRRDRQVRQTTVTVLVSNLAFVFLSLLPVSNSLANYLQPAYSTRGNFRYTYLLVHEIGQLSFSLRMCTDLFTFLLLSSGYRATLLKMIGRVFSKLTGDEGTKFRVDKSDSGTTAQSFTLVTL